MEKLTHQEEAVMQVIWQTGKGFIKDYIERLPDPKPPYTTVASVVKKLEDKGYLQGKKYGVIIEYSVLIPEKEYKRKFMKGFVKDYFENSYKELVTFFAKDKKISPEELKEIIKMIEESK
ncbi:MAG: BlaI/MecI/CopY family transcriptional regulator [Chitinophagaceae bacterium]|nr:MAG: BlaI/MecI/CopY family transcriptional regulator [Chitinophagaceae bacterium]